MAADPVLKPLGDSLFVIWKDRAVLEFARVSEHRDSLSAEVTVSNAAGTELHWARVNLASTQGRNAVVKAVEEAEPTDDWRPMIERACRLVAHHVRTGDPAVPLVATAPETAHRWAVEGWMPHGQITVLFGDGGSLKSYLALTLATTGLLDRALTPRWHMRALHRVLYLDWEADRAEQQTRLWRLTSGLGSIPCDGAILHRTMRRPLRDEIVALRTEVARGGVDFVIADSLAPASGPEPEHADAALGALLALRSLAVTVLCLAHVNKLQADAKAPARPYGSVHIQNLARSTIEARASEADDHAQATVSLYHRKSNHGPKMMPAALRFTFDPSGAIRIGPGTPDLGPTSVAFQLLEALRSGSKLSVALAEELDVTPATLRSTLSRLEKRGMVMRITDGGRGRGQETEWGLTDSKRGSKRDTPDRDATLSREDDDDRVPF